MEHKGNACKILVENLKGQNPYRGEGNIKIDFKLDVKVWIRFIWPRMERMVDFCGHGA
jgi:hypothetical protein